MKFQEEGDDINNDSYKTESWQEIDLSIFDGDTKFYFSTMIKPLYHGKARFFLNIRLVNETFNIDQDNREREKNRHVKIFCSVNTNSDVKEISQI